VENVKQDTSIGTNLLRVSASDEDADNNGAIIYTLHPAEEGSDDDQYFDIQPESGWISLKKPLHVSFSLYISTRIYFIFDISSHLLARE
jgi:hypothetical protein